MTPDLTCAACRERLPWHIAGSLAPAERAAVERHLATCAACRREAELWDAVGASLADSDSRIPADTHAAGAWLTLRGRLPRQSPVNASESRKARLVDSDTDAPRSAPRSASRQGAAPTTTLPQRQPRPPSRRPALAIPAAVLILALLAALFGFFGAKLRHSGSPATSPTSTPTPTSCAPGALSATLPADAIIQDISMTSPRSGWAVGWTEAGGPQSANAPTTLLMRFQNCQWQPVSGSIPSAELMSVSMSSATDGWAVGASVVDFNPSPAPGSGHMWVSKALFALHYADGQWDRISIPAAPTGFGAKLRMTSSGDGWMLIDGGKSHTTPYTTKNAYTLLHYQSGAWTPVPLTFDASGSYIFWDIAAMTPDDCWIVGYGVVAHYHQGVWTKWSDPQFGVTYAGLYSITMTGPNDVWASGTYSYHDANGDETGPLVLHYDGAKWTRESMGNVPGQLHEMLNTTTIAAQSPNDVWMFANAFAFGGGGPAYVAHERNGAWTWAQAPANLASIGTVVFVSSTEGFATGLMSAPIGGEASVLLHYSDGVWSAIPTT